MIQALLVTALFIGWGFAWFATGSPVPRRGLLADWACSFLFAALGWVVVMTL